MKNKKNQNYYAFDLGFNSLKNSSKLTLPVKFLSNLFKTYFTSSTLNLILNLLNKFIKSFSIKILFPSMSIYENAF